MQAPLVLFVLLLLLLLFVLILILILTLIFILLMSIFLIIIMVRIGGIILKRQRTIGLCAAAVRTGTDSSSKGSIRSKDRKIDFGQLSSSLKHKDSGRIGRIGLPRT